MRHSRNHTSGMQRKPMYTKIVWSKKMGPKNGILDSTGIGTASMIGAVLYFSASGESS